MRPDEAKQQLRALKAGVDSEAISQDEFAAELARFMFQDESGRYWTIGTETETWYVYRDGDWVPGTPPKLLDRVEGDFERPRETSDSGKQVSRSRPSRMILIGVASLSFVACLVLVALASYQYGRMSMTVPFPTLSPTMSIVETPTATVALRPSPTSDSRGSPESDLTTPTSAPTVEQNSPTATARIGSTATLDARPTPSVRYPAPELLAPGDGAQFGPGYQAVLEWRLVDQLGPDEYYHVEVCWNGCDSAGEFHGHYLRETSYLFPGRIYRGRAIDDRYHWHVVVRIMNGDQPMVPGDPMVSEMSETWSFLLPD